MRNSILQKAVYVTTQQARGFERVEKVTESFRSVQIPGVFASELTLPSCARCSARRHCPRTAR